MGEIDLKCIERKISGKVGSIAYSTEGGTPFFSVEEKGISIQYLGRDRKRGEVIG